MLVFSLAFILVLLLQDTFSPKINIISIYILMVWLALSNNSVLKWEITKATSDTEVLFNFFIYPMVLIIEVAYYLWKLLSKRGNFFTKINLLFILCSFVIFPFVGLLITRFFWPTLLYKIVLILLLYLSSCIFQKLDSQYKKKH